MRQFRSGLRDESIFDHDRLVAFGQSIWFFMGGGRPFRRYLIADKIIAQVIKREEGKCQGCAQEATTIDHEKTACNRPINLRAVCQACCKTKPFDDMTVAVSPQSKMILKEFAARIANPVAIRPCDDAENWNWREYLKKRLA